MSTVFDTLDFSLRPPPAVGLDFGGTMCKICYLERAPSPSEPASVTAHRTQLQHVLRAKETYGETGTRDERLEFSSALLGGRVYLASFETRKMARFIDMIKSHRITDENTAVYGTGGGARKHAPRIKELLSVTIAPCDELRSLVRGVTFMLRHDPAALYAVDGPSPVEGSFPYLLVNIGSGVSILKVDDDGSYSRVGGTSIGGSTFFGLCCMITGAATFAEALALAGQGDARNIDLLVGDIYGGSYDEFGLSADTVASSLGKLSLPEVRESAKREDIARAVLDAVTNNIGSLAMLHASAVGAARIIFAGSFLRANDISIARLSSAIQFWSKGERRACFLAHEGYLGSIGAMLQHFYKL